MQRITISVDDELFNQLDALIIEKGYDNRSEIFRDFIREQLKVKRIASDTGYCTAVISYAHDTNSGVLSEKLFCCQQEEEVVVISTLHVYSTKEECVEAVILHGKASDLRRVGEAAIATKGVRHGAIHLIPDPIKRRPIIF